MSAGPGLRGVQHWLVRQPGDVRLELVCAEHPDPARGPRDRTVVRLPACAGELIPAEVVELLTLGAPAVTIRLDGCASPADATALLEPLVELVIAAGSTGLTLTDPAPAPAGAERRRRPVLDATALPMPRRQLLGLGGAASHELPSDQASPHERLVAALRALATGPTALDQIRGPALQLTARGCTACGACVLACPTDALQLRHGAAGEELSISTLLQAPSRCDGCAACVQLCPTQVLTEAGRWPWARLLADDEAAVATVTTTRCTRCGTSFPVTTGLRLCAVCAYRRQNPFGSAPAPGSGAP
ncbi:ATP-binding protein [Pengzhenrongella sicca]|uniref:4Fe-4S binding protein n=1 Tax=Pengzhenrongella sicca TaxID=2819238 RepID=A0A8A4Z8U2_9MICO|nr:4Fe-4S binding protein [Pengzhenrongella sicca]QTE28292.1 4Fe-4S binding protein [Pengzhenrongella sicca]